MFNTRSEEQAEQREYEDRVAKASDHFLEDGVRTERSLRGEDYEPEHGKGRYSRDREWPGEPGVCIPLLVILSFSQRFACDLEALPIGG